MRQDIAHEVYAASLPGGVQYFGNRRLEPLMRIRDHQLDAAHAAPCPTRDNAVAQLRFEGWIIRVIEGLPSPRGRWRRGAGYHGLAFTSRWRPGAGNHRLAASTPTASSTMVGTWFITRVLGSVQEAGAALVELLAAVTAAEPAIALRGALRPMPDGR